MTHADRFKLIHGWVPTGTIHGKIYAYNASLNGGFIENFMILNITNFTDMIKREI